MFFNKNKNLFFFVLFLSTGLFASENLIAQDSSKNQTINITSSYKPVLRKPSKINFSGLQLPAVNSSINLAYSIPKQNLFYTYKPVQLKPLALQTDTAMNLGIGHFVKVGIGNLSTPYVKAGLGFGDGKKYLGDIVGEYIASKGTDIKYQDYSNLSIKGGLSYFLPKNEIFGGLEFTNNNRFKYGYDYSTYNFTKKDIQQTFSDFGVTLGLKNITSNKIGLNYMPTINASFFTYKDSLSETTIKLDIPLNKKINENIDVAFDLNADITNFTSKVNSTNNFKSTNNLIHISPSIILHNEFFRLNAGIVPTWNNGKTSILPNITAVANLLEKGFSIQAGLVGHFEKNTFKNLSAINPYLLAMTDSQINTREIEFYGGIKAVLSKHFNFNGKVGFISYNDLPLFINDTSGIGNERKFVTLYADKAKNFRVNASMSYNMQDKFSLTAGIILNAYTFNNANKYKAWGTQPMSFTGSFRWLPMTKLLVKSDVLLFSGNKYVEKVGTSKTTESGNDISVGAEYKIKKQLSIWLDVNNILNNKYERWHNYQSYGLNLLGGIIIKF